MIIFIDIDGVMYPLDGMPRNGFDPSAASALASLVTPDDRLIVHSTWRESVEGRTEAYAAFEEVGLPIDGFVDPHEPSKNRAIAGWLDAEFGPEHWPPFIIIDDSPEVFVRGCIKIRPNSMIGLTADDVRGCLCEARKDHP